MTGPTPKGAESRNRIMHIAAREFADRGYAATRMDRIIAESGFTKGAVYFHFASKQALAQAVIDEHKLLWLNTIQERVSQRTTGAEQLHALGQELIRMVVSDPQAWGVMRLAADLGGSCQGNPFLAWVELVSSILELGRHDGSFTFEADTHDLALVIVGGFDGVKSACSAAATIESTEQTLGNQFERRAEIYLTMVERLLGSSLINADGR